MVHVEEQLPHDGGQGYFTGLVAFSEALVERLQDGIAAAAAEGCHVQNGTNLSSSAADTALAFHRATLARPRGQAGQRRGPAAIHGSQLGQEDQRQQGGAKTDAFDFDQTVQALLELLLCLYPFLDLFFDGFDLALVVAEQLLVLLLHKRVGMMLGLGLGHGALIDELFEPKRQIGHGAHFWRNRGGGFGLEALAIIGQGLRITTIRFGPFPLGLAGGEGLGRVDDRDENFDLVKGLDDGTFVAAGGFTDHMRQRHFGQLLGQLSVALGVVFEFDLMAVEMDLQGRFGDVHADVGGGSYWRGRGWFFHGEVNVF